MTGNYGRCPSCGWESEDAVLGLCPNCGIECEPITYEVGDGE
jgi:NMD protein affecting ribosome stability and mRNA decay